MNVRHTQLMHFIHSKIFALNQVKLILLSLALVDCDPLELVLMPLVQAILNPAAIDPAQSALEVCDLVEKALVKMDLEDLALMVFYLVVFDLEGIAKEVLALAESSLVAMKDYKQVVAMVIVATAVFDLEDIEQEVDIQEGIEPMVEKEDIALVRSDGTKNTVLRNTVLRDTVPRDTVLDGVALVGMVLEEDNAVPHNLAWVEVFFVLVDKGDWVFRSFHLNHHRRNCMATSQTSNHNRNHHRHQCDDDHTDFFESFEFLYCLHNCA